MLTVLLVFVAYNPIEEKAHIDFIPVYFPPTHTDIEVQSYDFNGSRAVLGVQLLNAHDQTNVIADELRNYSQHMTDPQYINHAHDRLEAIIVAMRSLRELVNSDKPIANLRDGTIADVEQVCTIMQAICGSITEVMEVGKGKTDVAQRTHQAIWDDYNSHMRHYQGLDLVSLLDICQNFAQCLVDVLVW